MLLTDEEMWAIVCDFQKGILETGEVGGLCKAIRKAQLKEVTERLNDWYKEMCPHTNRGSFKYGCIECWLSLLKEVEDA